MTVTSESAEELAAQREVLIRRFSLWGRLTHGVLFLAVFGLVLTGMPLKYSTAFWASPLMDLWGGPHAAGRFHRAFAMGFFVAAGMHVAGLIAAAVRRKFPPLTGPDTILFRPQDAREFRQYIRFLRDRGPMPEFGRYTWWEKFDYFAEVWGLLVIGLSGLVMWFPDVAARYLPGWIVNAALIFHSYEALLAMGFLFTIHFFGTHLRPEVFPVDRAMFSGIVPADEVAERHAGWYRRLTSADAASSSAGTRWSGRAATAVSGIFLVLGIAMLLLVMSAAIAEVVRYLIGVVR